MTVQRQPQAESPRLHVSFLGREYTGRNGAQRFEVQSSLTNIYDGWSLDLPIGPEGLSTEAILELNLQRWIPIKLAHADPEVGNSKPIPILQGLCTRVTHACSDSASVLRLSGYDLGKLLDSAPSRTWMRLRGYQMIGLIDKLLEPTWLARNRKDDWGIRGVTGLNRDRTRKLGRASFGAAEPRQDVGRNAFAFMPPIQVEVGETIYDILSKCARLAGATVPSTGKFVNVSADGYVQIFNPDDYANDPPLYVLEDHLDQRNQIIKSSEMVLDGEDLYTDYRCFSSLIRPPGSVPLDNYTPNAGKIQSQVKISALGPTDQPIERRLTWADEQQYTRALCAARAQWRAKQSGYRELALRYVLQGHSMFTVDGGRLPIVEGNIVAVNSSRHRIRENMMIESVVKRQSDAPIGTESEIVLRRIGLLSA